MKLKTKSPLTADRWKYRTHLAWLLFFAVLSACICSGCTNSSEKHVVVQEKTELNTESYHSPAENDSQSENSLANRLQVPETNTYTGQFEGASLNLFCQAKIEVPDVDQVSVYKVGQKSFDQAWIDQVTGVFFGDLPVYDPLKYQEPTKEWAGEKLRRLKAFQAEGLTDPYGHIASAREGGSQNPEIIYNLEKDIEQWEQAYQEAPETINKVTVSPVLNTESAEASSFFGIVEMDGAVFDYKLKNNISCPMDIGILRESGEDPDNTWFGYDWQQFIEPSSSDLPEENILSREDVEKRAGITSGQAIKMADQYMEKLGLSDFSAKYTELSQSYCQPEDLQAGKIYIDAAYRVIYTRDVDGFPLAPETTAGGAYASMDGPIYNTWGHENVEFYVNQKGLQKAVIRNLYEIQEQLVDHVELMSFPEIIEIFGQMMPIRYENSSDKITVNKITLGYAKIYDPGLDSATGLLVPVWDFFGTRETTLADGQTHTWTDFTTSFLTINAADGTVIDRGLGY